jgi:hypothetical protein
VSKRLFVSFDFDHDRTLKTFVIAQARLPDSPFSVVDLSLKEAAPEPTWEAKARVAISHAQVFMIMLGPHSARSQGVLKELAMARELNKPCFQIIGYRNGTSAWAVPNGGRVYAWSWDNLKKLLA